MKSFLASEPQGRYRPWIVVLLACVALLIHVVPLLHTILQLDFTLTHSGQFWRLLTGHLTHWSASHFFWDTITFLVLGSIVERRDRPATIATLVLSSIAISFGI